MFGAISDWWHLRGKKIESLRGEAIRTAERRKDLEWQAELNRRRTAWGRERKRLLYENSQLQSQLDQETRRHTEEEKKLRTEVEGRVESAHAEACARLKQLDARDQNLNYREEEIARRIEAIDRLAFDVQETVSDYEGRFAAFRKELGLLFASHDRLTLLDKRIQEVRRSIG